MDNAVIPRDSLRPTSISVRCSRSRFDLFNFARRSAERFRSTRTENTGPRLVGTIRRECLDYVKRMNERHLRRILKRRTTWPWQGIVEWRFGHLAKQKEIADKEESAATVLGGEPSLAGAKPSTKSLKKGKLAAKHKSRLPRRQKKARQKAAGRL